MCAKSFDILLKTRLKTWANQSNLYADWNRCVFNVCLKDCSVGIVLMFSGNLSQSSGARVPNACLPTTLAQE